MAVALLVLGLCLGAVAGCGSSSSDSSSSGGSTAEAGGTTTEEGTSTGEASGASLKEVEAQVQAAFKGRYTKPPTEPNPATPGKKVGIVAVGLSSPTVATATKDFEAAAKALGWQTTTYDAKLDPSSFPKGVEQAVAAGDDAIVGVGLDAPYAKEALEEADEAGIVTASIEGWDLDEIEPGQEPVYTAKISFGKRYPIFADAMRAYGEDSAAYLISEGGGEGTYLNFTNKQYNTLTIFQEGIAKEFETKCTDCDVKEVPWLAEEFGPELQAKAKAALVENPSVAGAQGGTNPGLGIAQAIVQSGNEVPTVGGFGLTEDMELVREDKGLTAVNSWPTEWWSYAVADTVNSLFNGKEPRDEGLGWALVDAEHGLPPKGQDWSPPSLDIAKEYEASWSSK